ncbi:MAG: GNAT family N-acetyltransferase [Legionella sp.]
MNIIAKKISDALDWQACVTIRKKVFVEQQGIPDSLEWDGLDGSSSHYLLTIDNHPVGTARVRLLGDVAKVERVAILSDYQYQGYGRIIMETMLTDIRKDYSLRAVKLSSQVQVIPFYEKLGFIVCSDPYFDAGIVHQDMQLII